MSYVQFISRASSTETSSQPTCCYRMTASRRYQISACLITIRTLHQHAPASHCIHLTRNCIESTENWQKLQARRLFSLLNCAVLATNPRRIPTSLTFPKQSMCGLWEWRFTALYLASVHSLQQQNSNCLIQYPPSRWHFLLTLMWIQTWKTYWPDCSPSIRATASHWIKWSAIHGWLQIWTILKLGSLPQSHTTTLRPSFNNSPQTMHWMTVQTPPWWIVYVNPSESYHSPLQAAVEITTQVGVDRPNSSSSISHHPYYAQFLINRLHPQAPRPTYINSSSTLTTMLYKRHHA